MPKKSYTSLRLPHGACRPWTLVLRPELRLSSLVPLYMSDKLRTELNASGLTGTCSLTQFVLFIARVLAVGPGLRHVAIADSLAETDTWQHNVCSPKWVRTYRWA